MPPFRDRLLATLRAVRSVLEVPGVMVVGSEVPNLLEPAGAATLVVSQDVDLLVPLAQHAAVCARLGQIEGLVPLEEEPSVWLPESDALIEVNFLGQDPHLSDPSEAYPHPDDRLPLMVFGALSWLRPMPPIVIDGQPIPLPAPAGLLLEKLVTDRTGVKGDRDLLVALGLLMVSQESDLDEARASFSVLPDESRHAIRSNLALLALLPPRPGVPDPSSQRHRVAFFLDSLPEEPR